MGFFRSFVTSFMILAVLSCASSAGGQVEPEPEWLTSPPADGDFYYGVGGSDTGDEAADRENALVRARTDLAASISVDIVSVLEMKDSVHADGTAESALESRVRQSVEQSLMNLETVETWYRSDRGAWALVRMNRGEWEKLRREDRRVSVPVPRGLEELSGLNVTFLALLESKKLPLKLLPGGRNTPYEISLDWVVSDFPVLDDNGGIHFSKVSGVVSFKHYGLLVFSREFGPVKEGGLNYEQARERAAGKVMNLIREDHDLNSSVLEELNSQ